MDKYDVNTRSAIMMSRSSDEVEHRVSTALQVMMEMAKPYWTIVQRYVDDYETKIQDSIDLYQSLFKKGFEQRMKDFFFKLNLRKENSAIVSSSRSKMRKQDTVIVMLSIS